MTEWSEHDEIKQWLSAASKGESTGGTSMVFDRRTGSFVVVDNKEPKADHLAEVTPRDLEAFGLVLDTEHLAEIFAGLTGEQTTARCPARRVDGGDVIVVDRQAGPDSVLLWRVDETPERLPDGVEADYVVTSDTRGGTLRCFRAAGPALETAPFTVRPGRDQVFDRIGGIFETDALRDAAVAIFGVGSGGSFIARELAKAGVGRFLLIDHDRLEPANLCRHECGIDDLGRLKVRAVADVLRRHNPAVEVEARPIRVCGETLAELDEALHAFAPDVLICATDSRESRLLINRLALLHDKVCVYGGVMRRAFAGQVLRVVPGVTACYDCFLECLPSAAAGQEGTDGGGRLGYASAPVAAEPGLSSDILPVALHAARLALLEMLGTRASQLASLRQDLVAPLYMWFNRRDEGTEAANFTPMRDGVSDLSILRWYGTQIPRNGRCASCGDWARSPKRRPWSTSTAAPNPPSPTEVQ